MCIRDSSFTVTPTERRTTYVVVLLGTSAHSPDKARITAIVKKPGSTTGS